MRAKLGRAEAITAVAHKLARIFFALVSKGQAYDESALVKADARQRLRQEANSVARLARLGFNSFPWRLPTPKTYSRGIQVH